MLQSFRENTGKWFVKVLLGAIIASFALWGVADVVRNYQRTQALAKVGSKSISPEEFIHTVRQEMRRLQVVTKGQMSAEQMRAAGLYNFVLQKMIQDEALSQEVNRLFLDVPDTLIRGYIRKIKAFEKNGEFDKDAFFQILQAQDMSENEFVMQTYQSLINTQLMSALTAGTGLPNFYTLMLFKELDRQKVFTIVEVNAENISLKSKPTEDTLKNFYQTNQDHYQQPETRTVEVIWVPIEKIVSLIKVDPDELLSYYEDHKSELFPDGKVQSFDDAKSQIISIIADQRFPETISKLKDDIDDTLAAGQSLEEIAKERKWNFQKINGAVATGTAENGRSLIKGVNTEISQHIMNRAFALDLMQDSSFTDVAGYGAFIVRASAIQPPKIPPYEDVKERVNKDWTKEQKHRQAIQLAHTLSVEHKNLASFKKGAEKHGLKVKSSQVFRRSDFINNENQPAELTDVMLTKAFAQKVGQSVYGPSPRGAVVVFLESEKPYTQRQKDYEKFKQVMEQSFERDLSAGFVHSLKDAYKTEIDQRVFAQIMQQ